MRPDPAPNLTISDALRTLCNDGIMSYFHHALQPEPATASKIQHIEFITDINTNTPAIPTLPFSIRYYTQTKPIPHVVTIPIKIQIDGGANRSITSRQNLLHRFKPTSAYPIYGVNKDDIALQCVGRGYLPWVADNGDTVYIPMFYSHEAAETIISPTDVIMAHNQLYCAWAQFSHCTSGQGHVTFYRTDGTNHTTYSLRMRNELWYHDAPELEQPLTDNQPKIHMVIQRLYGQCMFKLWHNRLVHSCKQKVMSAHKNIKGVPKLKGNPFYQRPSCNHAKPKCRSVEEPKTPTRGLIPNNVTMTDLSDEVDFLELIAPLPSFQISKSIRCSTWISVSHVEKLFI